MRVHVVDGTYELFRHYFPLPSHVTAEGHEVGALRGVVGSILSLLEGGATHVGVATDHVIESFRNGLYDGYKTGEGIEPDLRSQFTPLEEVLEAAGVCVWPMVEHEADDALGAAAVVAAADDRVEQVLICTPDKDLAQCVTDDERVVQWDRRNDIVYDRAGVIDKFGVEPSSIPDYLGLVGDGADGFPGVRGWGAKSTSTVLARWHHIEDIPDAVEDWAVTVRGAARLRERLTDHYDDALLFKQIATLALDAPTISSVDELEWTGPRQDFLGVCNSIDAPGLAERAVRLAAGRRT